MEKHIYEQLKNKTKKRFVRALEKDDRWTFDKESNKYRTYRNGSLKVTIHYHNETFKTKSLLEYVLDKINWTEKDLKRLKLIKKELTKQVVKNHCEDLMELQFLLYNSLPFYLF